MADMVSLVIVSHSPDIARGAVDMVRQMVGEATPLVGVGGDPDGGLGSDAAAIRTAIEQVWSPAGVAVLVDLGGAETNAEMAVEMLPAQQAARVVICDAPLVEGAVMAGSAASTGAGLDEVRATAEELSPHGGRADKAAG